MSNNDTLEVSARLMYMTLNGVYGLHDVEQFEIEGRDKPVDGCVHCTEIANTNNPDEMNLTVVSYPCPTVSILLGDIADEVISEDETSE